MIFLLSPDLSRLRLICCHTFGINDLPIKYYLTIKYYLSKYADNIVVELVYIGLENETACKQPMPN